MRRIPVVAAATLLSFILAACAVQLADVLSEPPTVPGDDVSTLEATASEQSTETEAEGTGAGAVPRLTGVVIEDDSPPPFSTRGWETDFSRRTVEWDEILSGGPPKDGIPAVDEPIFESVAAASQWLSPRDPVILYQNQGMTRAYPLSILIWHEIVNDMVAGKPVSVTFCPLCNASIVFDREHKGHTLDFGTTGRLRNSDLIMYDRQTESWWQQFTGESIVGKFAGDQLTFLPSQVISFADFSEEFPDGDVLARPERNGRFTRDYGRNPYVGYDRTSNPFLFRGQVDDRLPATERVVGLTTEDQAKAYSFSQVREARVINDAFGENDIVIFHKPGTVSALDESSISDSNDIGAVAVFDRELNGRTLTFTTTDDGNIIDLETGTVWNILGKGISGELAGEQLTEILHFDHFWFAWAAFFPDTALYSG